MFVVFATNIDPSELVDEAFLRRIQTKIKIGSVTHEQFHEIFRRVCSEFEVRYEAEAVDKLIEQIEEENKQPLRPCYPRDLVQQVCWAARYERREPQLDQETLRQACHNYFLQG